MGAVSIPAMHAKLISSNGHEFIVKNDPALPSSLCNYLSCFI